MLLTKCNYEIYDKKLLIIMKTFEKWKSKCAKTSIKNFIKIFNDYRNLKHFMIFKQLNRRQVKWIEFLFEFNFQITYRFDKQNIKFDNLTKRIQNLFTNDNDVRKQYLYQTILKNKYLNEKIRAIISVAFKLMNEKKKFINIAIMLYDINEKKKRHNEFDFHDNWKNRWQSKNLKKNFKRTNSKKIHYRFYEIHKTNQNNIRCR